VTRREQLSVKREKEIAKMVTCKFSGWERGNGEGAQSSVLDIPSKDRRSAKKVAARSW